MCGFRHAHGVICNITDTATLEVQTYPCSYPRHALMPATSVIDVLLLPSRDKMRKKDSIYAAPLLLPIFKGRNLLAGSVQRSIKKLWYCQAN